jgi:hypothetical protein
MTIITEDMQIEFGAFMLNNSSELAPVDTGKVYFFRP